MESIDVGAKAADPPGTSPGPAAAYAARWVVLAVTLSAIFMQMLDTTITMVALPSLQSDLGATFAEIQLVVAVYSLAFACTLVTGGRLGDIHGRRKVFLIGMLGFTIASALCGAAPNSTFLIVSRVFQGLCSGLMFPRCCRSSRSPSPRRSAPRPWRCTAPRSASAPSSDRCSAAG